MFAIICPVCLGAKCLNVRRGWIFRRWQECRACEGLGEIPATDEYDIFGPDPNPLPDEPNETETSPVINLANAVYLTEADFVWSTQMIDDLIRRASVDGAATLPVLPVETIDCSHSTGVVSAVGNEFHFQSTGVLS